MRILWELYSRTKEQSERCICNISISHTQVQGTGGVHSSRVQCGNAASSRHRASTTSPTTRERTRRNTAAFLASPMSKAPSSRVVGCPETPPKHEISNAEARRGYVLTAASAVRTLSGLYSAIGGRLPTADHPGIPNTATNVSTAVLATCHQILLKLLFVHEVAWVTSGNSSAGEHAGRNGRFPAQFGLVHWAR